MSFELSPTAAGMIVLTLADRVANEFISLAAFEWRNAAEFDLAWLSVPDLPESDDDYTFMADRHDQSGMTDNRYVTVEWIEDRTKRPITELIAAGRQDNREMQKLIRSRRSAVLSKPRLRQSS